jgi:hypothetical protein
MPVKMGQDYAVLAGCLKPGSLKCCSSPDLLRELHSSWKEHCMPPLKSLARSSEFVND